MSQTIGRTRLAYSRAWHHISLSPTSTIWSRPGGGGNGAASPATTDAATPAGPAAEPPVLGRLASRIATLLTGKHKPIHDPSTDCGDYVVVTSCAQVRVSGNKLRQKKYYSHTTRPGSLKEVSLERLVGKWGGGEALRRAVRGMLPKNKLRDRRLMRLRCFEGEAHPYAENFLRFAAETPRLGEALGKMSETPSVMAAAQSAASKAETGAKAKA